MANVDAPFGLRPVRQQGGAAWTGAANRYHIASGDSTAAYVGGLVKLTGGADANGVATVTGNVATTNAVIGVIVGVEPVTADSTQHREASTERYVFVADDPNLIFEVQEDSTGGALAATAAGATCQLVGFTSGSAFTGRSAVELDSSELSETSDTDDDVLIIGAVQAPDNAIGTNCRWLVRLNNHAMTNATVGV